MATIVRLRRDDLWCRNLAEAIAAACQPPSMPIEELLDKVMPRPAGQEGWTWKFNGCELYVFRHRGRWFIAVDGDYLYIASMEDLDKATSAISAAQGTARWILRKFKKRGIPIEWDKE